MLKLRCPRLEHQSKRCETLNRQFNHFYMDNAGMKRFWLFFSQTVTVLLAALFIVTTLKPAWLGTSNAWLGGAKSQVAGITVTQAPAATTAVAPVGSFRAAAQKASAAVVSINVNKTATKNPQFDDPWFKFFFGERGQQGGQGAEPPQAGVGSGVIVSTDGYILTNNHVVEGADEIEVILNDGRRAIAKVIGTDPDSDLAILKITLDKLPAIVLGNSDSLQVGDQVLAVGNPFGVGQTVTSGIVSALNKNQLGINTFENFIQTDAAINPGNSGGALVDVNGNLQGINTAIYSRSGGSLGIGFAIPVSTAKQVMEGIVKDGVVTRGWIGVEPQDISPELAVTFGIKNSSKTGETLQGVIITGVLQGAPAAKAGIVPGDIIVSIGAKPTRNVSELLTQVSSIKPGNSEKFGIIRKEVPLELVVAVGTRPRPKGQAR
jgi:Do/DeqQ family serine protease